MQADLSTKTVTLKLTRVKFTADFFLSFGVEYSRLFAFIRGYFSSD